MKRPKPSQTSHDPASKEAIRHQAARAIIEQVEGRLAEEEESEQLQKPGRLVVRTLIGVLLIAWIIIMCWVTIRSLQKKEPRAKLRKPDVVLRHHC